MPTFTPTGSPMDEVDYDGCPVHDEGSYCDLCSGYIPEDHDGSGIGTLDNLIECTHPGAGCDAIQEDCRPDEFCGTREWYTN